MRDIAEMGRLFPNRYYVSAVGQISVSAFDCYVVYSSSHAYCIASIMPFPLYCIQRTYATNDLIPV
jgi:hypothetical protein